VVVKSRADGLEGAQVVVLLEQLIALPGFLI